MSKDVLKVVSRLVKKSKNAMVASVDDEGYFFFKRDSV